MAQSDPGELGTEHVTCNLCGHDDVRVRFPSTLTAGSAGTSEVFRCTHQGYGRHHTIVQCRNCGLMYANPRWAGAQIMDLYAAVEDPTYVEEREGRVLTFSRHLRPLERLRCPPGRLLDVGAHTGVFVEIASRHGWDALGVEPSRWAVCEARRRGLEMIEGSLESCGLLPESLDVITMWDLIEHLTDPLSELRRAHRLLKRGGLLVVHTMDVDSWFARVMGARWPWLMEMHIYYFSRRTLRAMLGEAGYQVVRITPQGRYSALGYLATRVEAFTPKTGRLLGRMLRALHVETTAVPVNLGDLVTAYAFKY